MKTTKTKLALGLDAKGVKQGVDTATDQFGRLKRNAKDTGESVARSSDRVAGATRKIAGAVAAATAAYATFVVKATKLSSEFTTALSDLSAITGATGKDLEYLSDQSRKLGASTTLSASGVAGAFKLVASAKPDLLTSGEALASVTKEVIALAEASGTDLTNAANTVGSALNQYGAGAEEAGRFVNVLAAGSKFGASEVALTAEALRDSGTVAAGAGISFEQLNASIQALASRSIKGANAGVNLRNVFLRLQIQSNKDFNPAIVGLTTALENLGKANLSTAELTKLFGRQTVVAGKTLIDSAGSIDSLTQSLTNTSTAYEQARIRNDNLAGATKRLNSTYEEFALKIGKSHEPGVRNLVERATDLLGVWNKVNDTVSDSTPIWDLVTDALTSASKVVNRLVETWSTMYQGYGAAIFNVIDNFQKGKPIFEGVTDVLFKHAEAADKSADEYDRLVDNIPKAKEAAAQYDQILAENAETLSKINSATGRTEEQIRLLKEAHEQGGLNAEFYKEKLKELNEQLTQQKEVAQLAPPKKPIEEPVVVGGTATGTDEDLSSKEKREEAARLKRLDAYDRELQKLQEFVSSEEEIEMLRYEKQIERVRNLEQEKFIAEAEGAELREGLQEIHADKMKAIAKKKADAEAAIERKKTELIYATMQNFTRLSEFAGKKGFEVGKAVSIALAIAKGYEAVQAAFAAGMATGGPAAPAVATAYAASAAVAAAANVASIARTKYGGGATAITTGGAPGTPVVPVSSAPAGPAGEIQSDTQANRGTTQILINARDSNSVITSYELEQLLDQIQEAVDRNDRIIFSSDSRQALEGATI